MGDLICNNGGEDVKFRSSRPLLMCQLSSKSCDSEKDKILFKKFYKV